MGGGNKDPNVQNPVSPTQPGNPLDYSTSTVQPFMPGFDQMIASQLQGGYGGNLQDILAAIQQVYRPMEVPNYGQKKPGPWQGGGGDFRDTRVPGDNGKIPIKDDAKKPIKDDVDPFRRRGSDR